MQPCKIHNCVCRNIIKQFSFYCVFLVSKVNILDFTIRHRFSWSAYQKIMLHGYELGDNCIQICHLGR